MAVARDTTEEHVKPLEGAIVKRVQIGATTEAGEFITLQSDGKWDPTNTGSAQFFIVLEPAGHLDGNHSVFGRCTAAGVAVANELANVAVGANDKPVEDEVVETVRIVRRPTPK